MENTPYGTNARVGACCSLESVDLGCRASVQLWIHTNTPCLLPQHESATETADVDELASQRTAERAERAEQEEQALTLQRTEAGSLFRCQESHWQKLGKLNESRRQKRNWFTRASCRDGGQQRRSLRYSVLRS